MNFKNVFLFRPGYIQPMKGIRSKTKLYNALYVIFKPLYPLMKAISPNGSTSTVNLGKAMMQASLSGYEKQIITSKDINALAAAFDGHSE